MLSRLSSCHGKPPHLLLQRLPQLIRRPVPDANRVQQRHVNDLAKLEHLHVPALGAELGHVALLRGLVGLQLVVLPAQLLLLLAQRSTLIIQLLQAQRARGSQCDVEQTGAHMRHTQNTRQKFCHMAMMGELSMAIMPGMARVNINSTTFSYLTH